MAGESISDRFNKGDSWEVPLIRHKWIDWDTKREPQIKKWQEIESYKYATDTTELVNGPSAFDHTTHIPETMEVAQDLEAILTQTLIPHEDWFTFSPATRSSAQFEKRRGIVAYLKNRHSLSGFRNVVRKLISDLVTYGNAFAQVVYVNEEIERGGKKKGYKGPKLVRISPYDIVFNPAATSFRDTPKIIREVITIPELLKRKVRHGFDEEAVNSLIEYRNEVVTTNTLYSRKNQQYVPAGFGSLEDYLKSDTVELLWFYGDIYNKETGEVLQDRMIVIADNVVLLNTEIDTWDGKPYIYHSVWQAREDNLWGMGPLDNIIGLNFQINHRENAKSDALDKMLLPDKMFAGDVEPIYDDETGQTIYLTSEGGAVQELRPDTSFLSFDLHIDRLERTIRRAARLPGDLVGFRSAGEKTLGEVTTLIEGAMRGFVHKAEDFEISLLQPVLEAEVMLAAENLFEAIEVPGPTEGGVSPFIEIDPEDLKVEGTFIAKGARRFARKLQLLSTLTQLSSTGLIQIAAPHISSKGVAELVAELSETRDLGIWGEFVALEEQAEQQAIAQQLQRSVAGKVAEPTLEEEMIDQALNEEGLPEEGDDGVA